MSYQFELEEGLSGLSGDAASLVFDDFEEVEFEEEFRALGLNPLQPTGAKPGSEEKVMMLAARYAAGLPLWHNSDCYDHGPRSGNLDLTSLMAGGGKGGENADVA